MTAHGPVPKRSDQRRRVNKPEGGPITSAPAARVVVAVMADESWHPIAADWFRSLGQSGQSAFYEPSDWQTARVWAELLSRQLASGRPSSQMIAAWAAGATELLTTEGARRRGRLELERGAADEDEQASVTALDGYRERFGA